jgi:3-oxoacyl-[acyl-carrier protein] reductase
MITQDYSEQTILITGAASGLGQAQMTAYLAAGASIIAVDKQPIATENDRLVKVQLDLSDPAAIDRWTRENSDLLAFVDVFLSTAGVLDAFKPALNTDLPAIDELMQINVRSAVQLTMAILPHMVARENGQILFMASIASQVAGGGGAAYTMSKHALVGWMKQLALDYASKNIHINAIAPGAINTPMNAADFAGDGSIAAEVAKETPIDRWADAAEVANMSLYLTSPEASYVQGQVLTIDGGWTIK